MTSVPFNVGLGDGPRLSSRVLRPPGGGHTDIFGAAEPEGPRRPHAHPQSQIQIGGTSEMEPQRKQLHAHPVSQIQIGNEEELKRATNGEKAHAEPENQENQLEQHAEPASHTDSAPQAEQAKMEPPKRVRVPPGGFSSGLW